MSRFNPAQLALSALCLALAVVLGLIVLAPLPEVPAAPTQARAEPADDTPLPRFDPPSRQAFAAVDERLVFNPSREPVAALSQPGATDSSSLPSDLSLVGVILDDNTKLAMFKSGTAPLAVGVPLGGSIEGWQVTRIDAESVALRAGGPEQEMSLSTNKAPPAPPPAPNAPRVFGPPNFVRPPNMVRNVPNANNANNNANNNNNNNNSDDDNDDN